MDWVCEYCDRRLSRKDALQRHYGTCKEKASLQKSSNSKLLQSLLNRVKKLEIENMKLTTIVQGLTQQNLTHISGDNNVVVNCNLSLGLKPYGNLNYDDLIPFQEQIENSFVNNIEMHIANMLKLIHKNPKLPQYQNVHIDGSILLVYLKDQGWSEKNAIEFINEFMTSITKPGMLQFYTPTVMNLESREQYEHNLNYIKCHNNPLLVTNLK